CNLARLLIHALTRPNSKPATAIFKIRSPASETGQYPRVEVVHQFELDCKVQKLAMANPHPTRSRFSGGKRLPSRKARSTRALLILFGTPCLRAFTDVCGFAMASFCTLQSRPEFIGFVYGRCALYRVTQSTPLCIASLTFMGDLRCWSWVHSMKC